MSAEQLIKYFFRVKNMKELKIDFEETDILELKRLFKTEDENEAVGKAIKEIFKKNVYENILSLKGNVN